MLVACHTNCYGSFGTRVAIEQIPNLGLENIELPIRTAGAPSFDRDKPFLDTDATWDDLKAVERLLDLHQMRVASCDITGGNPLDPQIVRIIKRKLDLANYFGVSVVVGNAGIAHNATELENLHSHLAEIGDHATRRGIFYCLKTEPGICQNHRLMLDTMRALQHPHVKLNVDTGGILEHNDNIEGEIALAKICSEVEHLHLRDTAGEFPQSYSPALGNGGAVDFFRVRELMSNVGFSGPYTLFLRAGDEHLTLAEYHQRVVESLSHLRHCGYSLIA